MSSSSRFCYQRLRKLPSGIEEEPGQVLESPATTAAGDGRRRPSWLRLQRRRRWRRPRVRIAGALLKRKAAVVRSALREVVKRLKEGRAHIGNLFAGNCLFMQVSPASHAGPTPRKSFLSAAGPHFYGAATSSRLNLSRAVS